MNLRNSKLLALALLLAGCVDNVAHFMDSLLHKSLMRKVFFTSTIIIMMAGCAGQAVRTETVDVAVSVPCIEAKDIPARPDIMREADIVNLKDFDAVVNMDKALLQWESYVPLLEAVLAGCAR